MEIIGLVVVVIVTAVLKSAIRRRFRGRPEPGPVRAPAPKAPRQRPPTGRITPKR